jgi:hypothetical protein
MIFSEWLQQQLNSHRMTGAELADRAGIAKASAYFYLDGSRIPGPGAIRRCNRCEDFSTYHRRSTYGVLFKTEC